MRKALFSITAILIIATAALMVVNALTANDTVETLAITVGITTYHFAMRLVVGHGIDGCLHNQVDYRRWWFREKGFEAGLYKFLQVKRWKKHVPTYEESYFDIRKHSMEEILGATCQSEIGHELMMLFSFAPVFTSRIFGAFWVMVITSVLAALMDSIFVIVQRYNRPRLVKLLEKSGEKKRRKKVAKKRQEKL